MSIPVWPSDLPRPLRSSWQRQMSDPRRKRVAENGPVRLARRYSAVATTLALSCRMSRVQRDIFWQFIEQTLAHGSRAFWMPDPATDGWPLITPSGEALQTPLGVRLVAARLWLCQIGDEMPVEGPIEGVHFTLSFTLQVLP